MSLLYIGYLAFTLAGALAFIHFFRIPFSHAKQKAAVFALIPTILVFGLTDMHAVSRGFWSFNPGAVIGTWLGNQPLEEFLFFAVIPFFGIVLFEFFSSRGKK